MDPYNKPLPQEFLEHHGIKGQRWGIRRYQNKDGTLTSQGERRYSDKKETGKKVAVGIAVGAAAAAGAVLTAYLIKKHGTKKVTDLANKVDDGKKAVEKILETPVASTPIHQIQMPKVSATKAVHEIPQPYSFETLMQQNDELLKKMYADLLR